METYESQGEKSNLSTPLETSQLKQIRTFQGDVADALHNQNESLVSIREQEVLRNRAADIPEGPSPEEIEIKKRKNDFIFLLIGSAFFIVVGSIGAWFGYQEYVRRTAPPMLLVPENRLISVSEEEEINISGLTREGFAAAFESAINNLPRDKSKYVGLKVGSGESERLATTAEFMNLLQSRAPGALVRSFDKLFMIGAIGENGFMIVKLSSFENTFAGMLSWETSMAGDLLPIFPGNNALKAIGSESVFKDAVVKNKDVRILSAGQGTSTQDVLLYSFFDNSMLIITDRIEALQTLIERLTREKLSR
ncbi:MAG: hypothetical protein A2758_00655 [Candidatus Zambryskibacteria bacterium RIFCSPHIGHO2_01_FULL_49_18]|uniref:Uncharacterized protein n=2 Tax=Candidatus Zambryskiibacteriota TaxID=1817925 RepID=A0A1G2T2U4_9BACT|nr:MAG: hypothetical protein A2758_00655 [Candidatus Zambryskibacteria bacterium RIFCSPHIGHO2_01_FULL_49_18]OHB05934.1 MAG: hypothetical protein A3A26_03240 [Candidatus Zambryskibacteria bacterium RIFCSPLOWO2_01_FULL_47_14]